MSVVPPDSPVGVRTDVKRFPDSLLYAAHVRPWHARLKQPRVAAVAIGKQRNQEEKTKADEQDYAHLANDPATAATGRVDCNRDGPPPFAAAHG